MIFFNEQARPQLRARPFVCLFAPRFARGRNFVFLSGYALSPSTETVLPDAYTTAETPFS